MIFVIQPVFISSTENYIYYPIKFSLNANTYELYKILFSLSSFGKLSVEGLIMLITNVHGFTNISTSDVKFSKQTGV